MQCVSRDPSPAAPLVLLVSVGEKYGGTNNRMATILDRPTTASVQALVRSLERGDGVDALADRLSRVFTLFPMRDSDEAALERLYETDACSSAAFAVATVLGIARIVGFGASRFVRAPDHLSSTGVLFTGGSAGRGRGKGERSDVRYLKNRDSTVSNNSLLMSRPNWAVGIFDNERGQRFLLAMEHLANVTLRPLHDEVWNKEPAMYYRGLERVASWPHSVWTEHVGIVQNSYRHVGHDMEFSYFEYVKSADDPGEGFKMRVSPPHLTDFCQVFCRELCLNDHVRDATFWSMDPNGTRMIVCDVLRRALCAYHESSLRRIDLQSDVGGRKPIKELSRASRRDIDNVSKAASESSLVDVPEEVLPDDSASNIPHPAARKERVGSSAVGRERGRRRRIFLALPRRRWGGERGRRRRIFPRPPSSAGGRERGRRRRISLALPRRRWGGERGRRRRISSPSLVGGGEEREAGGGEFSLAPLVGGGEKREAGGR